LSLSKNYTNFTTAINYVLRWT